MANVIFRAEDGSLQLGDSSVPAEVNAAVYRTTSDREYVIEGGVFVERSLDGSSSRNLCPTDR
jgi:hypothetical protein